MKKRPDLRLLPTPESVVGSKNDAKVSKGYIAEPPLVYKP